jgi:hypothetical protein
MKHWPYSIFAVFALAACSAPPPLQTFAPLDYSYLPPLVLKVASLNVVNNYVPSPSQATLIGEDPVSPITTLENMLNRRLVASGAPGTATIAIQTASIDQVNGNLTGTMTVDVSVSSPDGRSTGYAEATVSASQTAPDSDASLNDTQAALYGLTKRLMDDMNVQLQYQLQHNLSSWISWSATPGAAPLAAGATGAPGIIQATPLPPTAPATGTAPATPAAPANPVNTNTAVPNYLPGAGPAALGQAPPQ